MHLSLTAGAMCAAGIALVLIGIPTTRREVGAARGLEKIVALSSLCFAIPLAVFGALHLFGPQFIAPLVPKYMPWRMFWVYGIGCALLAASVSIAINRGVQWSGLLFGIMMFLFVAMIHLPGAVRFPHNRIFWTIVCRELAFGGAGWILAGTAVGGWSAERNRILIAVGRVLVTLALVLFGVEHFLHPTALPGVPLPKEMAAWIPARVLIDYVTGAALLVVAGSVVLQKNSRTVAAWVGGWLLLLVVVMYVPVMIAALAQPEIGVQVEGINYFADTLLFAATILALARSSRALLP
jgi:uncharacterized membrane protein